MKMPVKGCERKPGHSPYTKGFLGHYGLAACHSARHELFQDYGQISPMKRDQYEGLKVHSFTVLIDVGYDNKFMSAQSLFIIIKIHRILPPLESIQCLQ